MKRFTIVIVLTVLSIFFSVSGLADPGNQRVARAESMSETQDTTGELQFDDEGSESGTDIVDIDDFGTFDEDTGQNETVSFTRLKWSIGILLVTGVAGVLVRFPSTRNLRALFMLGSVVILGFYRGGCPCMISSFQNALLAVIGVDVNLQALVWFLGLVPLTYVFGKVWCGWVCHLGALQEFLYIPKRFQLFRSRNAQRIMHQMRVVLLVALVVQVLVSKRILFNIVGPFKVAFNLFSSNVFGYFLLALLLISSAFMYRPFCKAVCPVGLILGWISKIPGAALLGIGTECSGCSVCDRSCDMDAITRVEKTSILRNQDCILCGNCIDSCRKGTISFFKRRGGRHEEVVLKGIIARKPGAGDLFDI